jgi:transposase-like protein
VVETTMELSSWLRKQVEEASPDLVRAMVQEMAEALMGAEADALCGAGYGERTPERLNGRNGYREREWDTRVGTIELAVPKLRAGSTRPARVGHSLGDNAGAHVTTGVKNRGRPQSDNAWFWQCEQGVCVAPN